MSEILIKTLLDHVDGSTTQSSAPILIDIITGLAVSVSVIGGSSLAGNLIIYGCNTDAYQSIQDPIGVIPSGLWDILSTNAISSVTGTETLVFNYAPALVRQVYVKWVPTGGTGTILVVANGKEIYNTDIPLLGLENGGATNNQVLTWVTGQGWIPKDGYNLLGSGTVTSVGLTVPSILNVSGTNPITNSGTFAITLNSQSGNVFLASPNDGSSGVPGFRTVAVADLPTIPSTKISGLAGSATTDTTNAANISTGTLPSGRLSGSYSGVTGVGTLTAGSIPASLVSGLAASATTDATNATNIGSGTLASARISGSYTGITGVGTLSAGSIPSSLITGLATSATTDTTNASNISSGSLSLSRLSTSGAGSGNVMTYNGSVWAPAAPGSGGTVTSVGVSVPADLSVSGSPVTTSGTIAITRSNQSGNVFLASPSDGSSAAPGYRTIASADLPSIPSTKITGLATSATTDTTNASNITSGTLNSSRLSGSYTGITGLGTLSSGSIPSSLITGLASSATTDTTNASNITSGTLNASRLPTITTLGTITAGTWNGTALTASYVPALSALSGSLNLSQISTSGATNNYYLQYTTGGGIAWAAVSGGGVSGLAAGTDAQKNLTYTDAYGNVDQITGFDYRVFKIDDDFVYSVTTNPSSGGSAFTYWLDQTGGTGATIYRDGYVSALAHHMGIVQLHTGSTTTGYAELYGPGYLDSIVPGDYQECFMVVRIPTLSNSTDRFTASFGTTNTGSGSTMSNGISLQYSDNLNSGNWTVNIGGTTTNTGVAVVAGTWYRVGYTMDASCANVYWYVAAGSGTPTVGHITSGLPTAGSGSYHVAAFITKSAGTTDVWADVDKIYYYSLLSRS